MCETNGEASVLSEAIEDYSTQCQRARIKVCDSKTVSSTGTCMIDIYNTQKTINRLMSFFSLISFHFFFDNSGACPLDSKVDLAIVLDSSSSVKAANWPKMINVVLTTLDEFTIAPDKTHVAVFRYNKDIDTDSQILFGQFNEKESLYAGIQAIPYNGRGS